jgi:hypothetical protein
MQTHLAKLACGKVEGAGDLAEILRHLGNTIDVFVAQLDWLSNEGDERVTAFGPFVGRSLLELAFSAVISRLDPFRLLYLRELQQQPSFEIGIRRAASTQWQGDVVAKEKPPQELWDPTVRLKRSRAHCFPLTTDTFFGKELSCSCSILSRVSRAGNG